MNERCQDCKFIEKGNGNNYTCKKYHMVLFGSYLKACNSFVSKHGDKKDG